MVNPRTVNAGIIVPLTGADVDLWGEVDVNPNMVALDGFIGGVATIAVTGAAPVTLTAPAGFTATPTPGPTESQNRVLRFTGALVANQQITLPLPGVYVIENLTTNPSFVLSFRGAVAATEVVGTPQGDRVTIYNDGSNVRFVDLGKCGDMEFWAGLNAMPQWVGACTVKPYLLCDSAGYNFSDFPYLGQRLGASFGGNGITTFQTPDLRGRYPLSYDGTGTRVTVAGCGINGQTLGAALSAQTVTLTTAQMPSHYHTAGIYDPGHIHSASLFFDDSFSGGGGVGGGGAYGRATNANTNSATTGVRLNSTNGLDSTYSTGGGSAHNNMPNTIVAGIWVIKT